MVSVPPSTSTGITYSTQTGAATTCSTSIAATITYPTPKRTAITGSTPTKAAISGAANTGFPPHDQFGKAEAKSRKRIIGRCMWEIQF